MICHKPRQSSTLVKHYSKLTQLLPLAYFLHQWWQTARIPVVHHWSRKYVNQRRGVNFEKSLNSLKLCLVYVSSSRSRQLRGADTRSNRLVSATLGTFPGLCSATRLPRRVAFSRVNYLVLQATDISYEERHRDEFALLGKLLDSPEKGNGGKDVIHGENLVLAAMASCGKRHKPPTASGAERSATTSEGHSPGPFRGVNSGSFHSFGMFPSSAWPITQTIWKELQTKKLKWDFLFYFFPFCFISSYVSFYQ